MLNCKSSKRAISFQIFCNVSSVTCSHMPFECIHYSITQFIFEYVNKIIPDPPQVIRPPLWSGLKICIKEIMILIIYIYRIGCCRHTINCRLLYLTAQIMYNDFVQASQIAVTWFLWHINFHYYTFHICYSTSSSPIWPSS